MLPEAMRGLDNLRMLLYAIVLIVVMLFTWSPKLKEFLAVTTDRFKKLLNKKKEVGTNE
jgi:branched-chain amino acid transport system permease protein